MENPSRPAKSTPSSFKVFCKANWAGSECFRVAVTYANGDTKHLAPEFKDEAGALRYMNRFHSTIPRE